MCAIYKKLFRRIKIQAVSITLSLAILFSFLMHDTVFTKSGNYVTVLMYHHFITSEIEPGNTLIISEKQFEEHLKYFSENNYIPIFLDDLYYMMNNDEPLPEKYIVITFDDGYASNYEIAFPLLKKYGMRANISLVTSSVDKYFEIGFLSSEQIKEMEDSGYVKFYSHGNIHVKHAELSKAELNYSITQSESILDNLLKLHSIKVFTYPFGNYSSSTVKTLQDFGYNMQLLTRPGVVRKNTPQDAIPRIGIKSGMTPEEIFKLVENY